EALIPQTGGQRADDVICLISVAAILFNPRRAAEIPAKLKLLPQFRRRRITVGLVSGEQLLAVGVGLGGIEGAGDVLRLFLLYQLIKEIAEAENSVAGIA